MSNYFQSCDKMAANKTKMAGIVSVCHFVKNRSKIVENKKLYHANKRF